MAGQAWVSTALKEFARIAEKVAASSSDLRIVRSICGPKNKFFNALCSSSLGGKTINASNQYPVLMNFVLRLCNQRRLMGTLCAIRDDDLSNHEPLLVSQLLYSCLSTVPPSVSTKAIQAPKPLKKTCQSELGPDEAASSAWNTQHGRPSDCTDWPIGENAKSFLGQTEFIEWHKEPNIVDPNDIIIGLANPD